MKATYTRNDRVKILVGSNRGRLGTVYTVYGDQHGAGVSVILDGPNALSTTNRLTYDPIDLERIT